MIDFRIVDCGNNELEYQYRYVIFTVDASGSLCPPNPDNMWSPWITAEWVKVEDIENV